MIMDIIFYSVIGFSNVNKYASFSKDGYVRKGNAQRVARKLIKEGYKRVVIRLEEVFLRDENIEISSSEAIELYSPKGLEILRK